MKTGDGAVTIEEIIRQRTREVTDTGKYHSREIFTRDSTLRKIKAAEYFAPILKEKFGGKYPSLDWNETAAELSVLSDTSPDDIARDTKSGYALAIFILDSVLYGNEGIDNFDSLKSLIPGDVFDRRIDRDVFDFFERRLYEDCSHPVYPDPLITDLMTLITFRNCDYVDYRKEKSGLGRYAFIADSYTTSLTKPQKYREGEIREIYEKIMAMVGKEFIEDAVEAYRTLFIDLIGCFLEAREKIQKQNRKFEGQTEWLETQMKENRQKLMNGYGFDHDEASSLLRQLDELEDRREKFEDSRMLFEDSYASGDFSSPELLDRFTESFRNVSVPDPYKVIAGFFFLFEEGDDWAWLTGSATATFGFAANLLPWVDTEWSTVKDVDYMNTLCGSYGFPASFHKPFLDPKKLQFSENDEEVILSPAKLVYALSRGVIPRYMVELPYRDKLTQFMSGDDIRMLELMYVYSLKSPNSYYNDDSVWKALDSARNELRQLRKELEDSQKSTSGRGEEMKTPEAGDNSIGKLEAENRRLAMEVERLEGLLSEKNRALEKIRKEKAGNNRRYRNEEEELYSLRELIFSEKNGEREDEEDERKTSTRSWPYRTKSRIVLVGGHPDWINKMKALLPDVRFYGDRVPPKEVLKNTDVLWIQTKICLSHSTFYKLVDSAKNLDLPIRYLLNFGIYTSAEAVAVLDEKGI